ncbi:oxysterol-binding protein-related protein 3-like, partial [Saccoglossus kowalevskii]
MNISHGSSFPIYLLQRAKTTDSFQKWVTKLRGHRLYRQHHIAFGSKDVSHLVNIASPTVEYYSTPLSAEARRRSLRRDISRSRSSTLQSQTSLGYDRVTAWLSDSVKLDQCNKGRAMTR